MTDIELYQCILVALQSGIHYLLLALPLFGLLCIAALASTENNDRTDP